MYWNDALADDLLRFFAGRVNCRDTASDLTHETFLRFHKFIQSTPPDNARALAFGIAVNLATDYQRKMKVRQKVMVANDDDSCLPASLNSCTESEPERVVMANQQLQLVCSALEELPEDCRKAFIMQSIHGLTQAQIADRLVVSQAKVYRLLLKAMNHCQSRLNAGNEPKS